MTENKSGVEPIEYKCLVLMEKPTEAKIGNIYIPEAAQERKELADVRGTLVAIGGKSFEDFGEPKPKIGDRVLFAKYGGKLITGADGQNYRLVQDKDITAILTDERAVSADPVV